MSDSPAVILFDINGNPIGVTDVLGEKALKVDVVKTVSSGSVGSGGTSSNFIDPMPLAGTAVGYSDGYRMRSPLVYDLDTSGSSEYVQGINLRTFGSGGSLEFGTNSNPIRIDPTGATVQPVSGTLTVNQGTSPWITISPISDGYLSSILANQINGTQRTIIDGYVQTNPNVIVSNFPATQPVSGTFWQATQPVSGTITANAGTGTFTVGGSVTANIGTSGSLALDATLTGGTQLSRITDGTNTATVKAASTAAIATDKALVVAISPNNSFTITGSGVDNTPNSTTKLPVLSARANTSPPAWTDGYMVPLSVNATGSLRTTQPGVVSVVNSTTTPLLANATFTGSFEEVKDYSYVTLSGYSDVTKEEALQFQWSGDGINIDQTETITFDANIGRAITTTVRARYLRVVFTNGITNQTIFRLSIVYHTVGSSLYTKPLDVPVNSDSLALLTDSVITGKRQDGYYGQIGLDNLNRLLIALADSPQLDAFGRLRISQPRTIFDNKMIIDSSPLFWDDQQTSGSGTTSTFVVNQSMVNMAVSTNTVGTRVRQTFRRFNYQSGKSQFIIMTGILGAGASGITRRLGYFDGYNGLYFDLAGTTLGVVVRSFTSGSVVNTKINQSAWNLDKLDGTSLSGYTLDTSKDNIFVIDFQWLGAGRVRFGFDIDGQIIYCHEVLNANKNIVSYMQSPNLPLRYEISNNGTGAASSLYHICSSISVEGGVEDTGVVLSIDRGITAFTTASTTSSYPLIAIKLKNTALASTVFIERLSIICTTTAVYRYSLVLNPTIVGTALSFVDISNSAIQQCSTTTNATTITGGTTIISGYDKGGNASSSGGAASFAVPPELSLGASIAGTPDILVIAVNRITGTTEDFYAGLTWREEI